MASSGLRLLAYLLITFRVGWVSSLVYIATGTNHTFSPPVKGDIESIDWRHKDDLIYDWDINNNKWYRYEERAKINLDNGALSLVLKKEDSGTFKCSYQVKQVLYDFHETIEVMDPVSQPKVTCNKNDTKIILVCSVTPSEGVSYKWKGPDSFTGEGERLEVSRNKYDKAVFFCTASNKVSEKTEEFRTVNCAEDISKGGLESSNVTGVVVGVLVPILLLVIVLGYLFRNHLKALCNRKPENKPRRDEEKALKGQNELETKGGNNQKNCNDEATAEEAS